MGGNSSSLLDITILDIDLLLNLLLSLLNIGSFLLNINLLLGLLLLNINFSSPDINLLLSVFSSTMGNNSLIILIG